MEWNFCTNLIISYKLKCVLNGAKLDRYVYCFVTKCEALLHACISSISFKARGKHHHERTDEDIIIIV